MREWAMEHGATHFTHWFQPMTGLTAEKHDSFLVPTEGGTAVAEFSGKELVRGEPDASSFPSGGIRTTFEARGYTAWDPTSPAFILDNPNGTTLCIPTAFCSWTGEALDKKTPLLRSVEALSKHAVRILKLFGSERDPRAQHGRARARVFPDRQALLFRRPDLINAGRTLFGAKPPKGQELEDHYFGAIPERVLACMLETETELYKLGVPVKTRHNEVSPAQYELAVTFENANVATDHNMLVMETMKRVADRYGLQLLLHEKPFAGVNGSGKHLNWSMADDTGSNLLKPGETPHAERPVPDLPGRGDPRRPSSRRPVARLGRQCPQRSSPGCQRSAAGDHLGFPGRHAPGHRRADREGRRQDAKTGGELKIGSSVLPTLPRDPGDRNRTSPFAFTGNKFEFRAVGSSQSVAGPIVVLNTIVAESLDEFATQLEAGQVPPARTSTARFRALLQNAIKQSKDVIFNGDNYTESWHAEAERRGLPNKKTSVESFPDMISPKSIKLFSKYGVFNERELHSRYEIFVEGYRKTINIESQLTLQMARRMILPAALRYQAEIAQSIAQLESNGHHRRPRFKPLI